MMCQQQMLYNVYLEAILSGAACGFLRSQMWPTTEQHLHFPGETKTTKILNQRTQYSG